MTYFPILNLFGDLAASITASLPLAMTPRLFYAIPLIVVISLVYGATRHENLKEIFVHSFRSAVWVVGFMAIIFALIWVAGFWN